LRNIPSSLSLLGGDWPAAPRYELTDGEWTYHRAMLPKPRGVPRVNDRRVLNGIFWALQPEHHGAICPQCRNPGE
jgi:transposase